MKDLIASVLENFKQQSQRYEEMADLSEQQLKWLQNNPSPYQTDALTLLLQQRQAMIETIDALNTQNRVLQEQISQGYHLNEFVLSQLKEHLEEDSYLALQSVISDLGRLLSRISEMDATSHQLLKDGAKERAQLNSPKSTNTEANQAYKRAMTQGKKTY